jgi:hypothetical protein
MKNDILVKYVIPTGYKPVYHQPYKDIYVDESNHSLLSVWNDRSEMIDHEIYKNECFQILKLVIQYSITNMISDVTMNRYIIPAELQLWYAKEIAPQFAQAGLKKCALIVESDLSMIGSLEEIANNASKGSDDPLIPIRFFSSLKDAHHWAVK